MRSAPIAFEETDLALSLFMRRIGGRAAGLALLAVAVFGLAALATWNVADPSFSHATANPVTNAMGYPGAVFADLALQFFGLGAVAALVPTVLSAFFLGSGRGVDRLPRRAAAWLGAALIAAGIAGCITPPPTWPLPNGLGGVFGDMVLALPTLLIGHYPSGLLAILIAVILAVPALFLFAYGGGLLWRQHGFAVRTAPPRRAEPAPEFGMEDDDEDSDGIVALGFLAHWWLTVASFVRRRLAARRAAAAHGRDAEPFAAAPQRPRWSNRASDARIEPDFAQTVVREPVLQMDPFDDEAEDDDILPATEMARRLVPGNAAASAPGAAARVAAPAPRPAPGARVQREAQTSLIKSDEFEMPSLHFLAEPKNVVRDPSLSKDALEQNARLLEGVLEDFGVRGEIIHVRPGPVVTLYELEPAPGIKSSRVIGARRRHRPLDERHRLPRRRRARPQRHRHRAAQCQARDRLSARAARQPRLRDRPRPSSALALGKTIGGEPVIADLAKHAAPAGRRHHRLGQVGRHQHHDPVAPLPADAGASAG